MNREKLLVLMTYLIGESSPLIATIEDTPAAPAPVVPEEGRMSTHPPR